MIVLATLAYYAVAFGLLATVAFAAGRRNNRLMRQAADDAIAQMRAATVYHPPLPSYPPEHLPEDEPDAEDEDADTIATVREQLAELADRGYPVAAALKEVDALARQVGV